MITYTFLNRTLSVDPQKPALITRSKKLTYAQLFNAVEKERVQLNQSGIKEQTIVSLPGKHDIDFVIELLALWQLGTIPVPLNTRLTDTELSAPGFLLSRKNPTQTRVSVLQNELNREASKSFPLSEKSTESQLFPLLGERAGVRASEPDPAAIIIFTSGSTGRPKGVVLSTNNLLSSADVTNNILKPGHNDSWLATLPFYHIGGVMVLVRAFLSGLTVILPESFDAEEIAFHLKENRPAFMSLVPTVMKRLLEKNIYPNSEMKRVLLGGGPVKNELAHEAVSKGWEILKVYGASETCSMFTALDINNNMDKLSSAGLPLPGNKIKIVNEKHEEVPTGESGEVAAAGPTVFREYLNDEDLTREKKKDGYYYTGDLGRVDNEGYLYIESRRTDLIISGGENISPAEIEEALLTYPDIEQVCVIAQPDEEWGQIPVAVIKTAGLQAPEAIIAHLRERLAGYKLPKRIIFVDEFPMTVLGKINREELRKKIG